MAGHRPVQGLPWVEQYTGLSLAASQADAVRSVLTSKSW